MADDYADDIVVSAWAAPILPSIPIIVSDSVCGKNAKIIHV